MFRPFYLTIIRLSIKKTVDFIYDNACIDKIDSFLDRQRDDGQIEWPKHVVEYLFV
jgi:hypothetical protein